MQGKVADVVMAVRNGEQIVRKYQPVVSNPSTPNQVAARAKLKLLSQLSAVMAPVIAMRRSGTMSARNVFVKSNYPAATFVGDEADITLADVKITKSVISMSEVTASRGNNNVTVQLASSMQDLSRVVYAFFAKQNDKTLRYVGSEVVTVPGETAVWSATKSISGIPHVVYAYGVRDNTEAARTKFGDMEAPTAEEVAKLIVSSVLTEGDISLTETRFAAIPVAG